MTIAIAKLGDKNFGSTREKSNNNIIFMESKNGLFYSNKNLILLIGCTNYFCQLYSKIFFLLIFLIEVSCFFNQCDHQFPIWLLTMYVSVVIMFAGKCYVYIITLKEVSDSDVTIFDQRDHQFPIWLVAMWVYLVPMFAG